jgi:hypothetical protein
MPLMLTMPSEEYAIVMLPGGGPARVWPTRARGKESFEAYCATFGTSVIRVYPSLEEAVADLTLPIAWGFRGSRTAHPG